MSGIQKKKNRRGLWGCVWCSCLNVDTSALHCPRVILLQRQFGTSAVSPLLTASSEEETKRGGLSFKMAAVPKKKTNGSCHLLKKRGVFFGHWRALHRTRITHLKKYIQPFWSSQAIAVFKAVQGIWTLSKVCLLEWTRGSALDFVELYCVHRNCNGKQNTNFA